MFSLENGEATIVVQVPWVKARSFLRFVLGWSYADRGAPYRLHRENPQYHPRFVWLSAGTVSFSGLGPEGTENAGTRVPGAFTNSLPIAAYQLLMATVRFVDRPWLIIEDANIATAAAEPQRNTYFQPVPSVEIISAEGLNNIKFGNGPSRGQAIPAPFGTLMSKITKTFNWMYVPHEYVSGSDPLQFTPNKIMSVVGRVNSDTFLGHPPGTLLLQAPVFQRFRFPLQTAAGVQGYFGWNIQLPMQFFDPTRGSDQGRLTNRIADDSGIIAFTGTAPTVITTSSNVSVFFAAGGSRLNMTVTGVGGSVIQVTGGTGDAFPAVNSDVFVYNDDFRGHQLVPRRQDLLWYAAVREDGRSKLYPEAAYSTIFTHVGAP